MAVAVAVTDMRLSVFIAAVVSAVSSAVFASVLPEERADVMYHRYDGGGMTIDGPSVLVRKNATETLSVVGNYYVDKVSSASIDVIASGASRYSEERTEYTVGADYLYNKSILSAALTTSDENDYEAETASFGISQDFFGDLTTVTLGYARGNDDVFKNGDDTFAEHIDRQHYRFGLSQIVTPSMIVGFNYEAVTDEGYLNNPYRSYRFQNDPNDPSAGFQYATEVYPDTRTSDAAAIRFKYFLPYRAAILGEYRYFTDDWGIDANTFKAGYTHTIGQHWILEFTYRYYDQDAADFYSDLFRFQSVDEKDYRARDKELSDLTTTTYGFAISYEFPFFNRQYIDRAAIGLHWDYIEFEYNNFRDATAGGVAGEEPLYSFEADVIRAYFSVWY